MNKEIKKTKPQRERQTKILLSEGNGKVKIGTNVKNKQNYIKE